MRDHLVAVLDKRSPSLKAIRPSQLPLPLAETLPKPVAAHPDFLARAAIWRDRDAGLISTAEASRRSAAINTQPAEGSSLSLVTLPVLRAPRQSAPLRPRHSRPAPNASRQYAGDMATTAARDDRLTPNAKAFLQVLRARCGKSRVTEFAKATLAAVISRSSRTIRRYLVDLERFGYIKTEIRRTGRGFHTGLVVTITEKVLPFFEETKGLARWLAEKPAALFRPFEGGVALGSQGVTKLTRKNQTRKYPSLTKGFGREKDRDRAAAP